MCSCSVSSTFKEERENNINERQMKINNAIVTDKSYYIQNLVELIKAECCSWNCQVAG